MIINSDCLTKRLRVTKMKQKYHKKYKTQQMLFSVASYYFTIMWQSVQIVMMVKCHISNILASLRRCKDKHFSQDTIKTPRLSAHIYYIGLGATEPPGTPPPPPPPIAASVSEPSYLFPLQRILSHSPGVFTIFSTASTVSSPFNCAMASPR